VSAYAVKRCAGNTAVKQAEIAPRAAEVGVLGAESVALPCLREENGGGGLRRAQSDVCRAAQELP
jgi:hypothetical protein